MRRALLAAVFALSLSCGPGPVTVVNNCCMPTSIQRGFGYAGSYVGDGGVATQVQLIVGVNGVATVSFVRGGDQVVGTFETTVQ